MRFLGHLIQIIRASFTELVTLGPGQGTTILGLPIQLTFYRTGAPFAINGQQHSFYFKVRVFEEKEAFMHTIRLRTLVFEALFDRCVHDITLD